MNQIVTVYRIRRFSAPDSDAKEESCSLLPFRAAPGLRGRDDGGRDYVLPTGYSAGTGPDGGPAVFNGEGFRCSLLLHNGAPLLVDGGRRLAHLLEPVKKIATYRQLAGLTLSELAERLGVEPKTLYEWENLEREPDRETLSRIASILGCGPSDLL